MHSSSTTADKIMDLPHEIILLIAKQLDAFSLILLSSTSKHYWQLLSSNDLWAPHFFKVFNNPPCLQDCLDLQVRPETFYRNSFFRKKGISNISDSVISPNTENPYFNIQLLHSELYLIISK